MRGPECKARLGPLTRRGVSACVPKPLDQIAGGRAITDRFALRELRPPLRPSTRTQWYITAGGRKRLSFPVSRIRSRWSTSRMVTAGSRRPASASAFRRRSATRSPSTWTTAKASISMPHSVCRRRWRGSLACCVTYADSGVPSRLTCSNLLLAQGRLRLPGHLDHVLVGVEALEADVGLGVLVIHELNAVGHKAGPKCLDLLR